MRELSQIIDDQEKGAGESVTFSAARQLELFKPEEIVRPDYNIGKYAAVIFASPYQKNLTERRVHSWPIKVAGEDGGPDDEAVASIAIHPLKDLTVPTTTTFKVFMAMIQIWRIQGAHPDGSIYFSDRQLAEVAGWPYSGNIAERIRTHIDILQGTSIDWIFAFKRKTGLEHKVQKMHLVDEVMYIERSEALKRQKFKANHTVRLNATLVQNMLNNVVRPLNHDALRQISSDASTRLYIMLDLYLSKKSIWQRRSLALLADDLGYEGKRYENRGERKRKLRQLCNDLQGKELTNGKLDLVVTATADGNDWKLIARKIPRLKRQRKPIKRFLDKEAAEHLADELLEQFHGLPKAGPPKLGYMVFLCEHYPESVLRDALSRAKADYRDSVRKTIGACFSYELKTLVDMRGDLHWYNDGNKTVAA